MSREKELEVENENLKRTIGELLQEIADVRSRYVSSKHPKKLVLVYEGDK